MTKSLYHYGILGMKWGVRRSQADLDRRAGRKAAREAEREKLNKVSKSKKKIGMQDRKIAMYGRKSLAGRLGQSIGGEILTQSANVLIRKALMGQSPNPFNLTKAEIVNNVVKVVAVSVIRGGIDAAARSKAASIVAQRYDDKGNLRPDYKRGSSSKVAPWLVPAAHLTIATGHILMGQGYKSLVDVARQHKRNQEIFESWGANILPQKASLPSFNLNKGEDGIWR